MSWWSRSIANSLKLDEEDEDDLRSVNPDSKQDDQNHGVETPTSPPRGVKDDLSDLTKTLSRQFWGVASFLAPPPPQPVAETGTATDDSDPDVISGIRNDFAEIGGKFRTGISRLSNNINVSDFTKMATDFLQLGSNDEEEKREGFDLGSQGAIGVTEEVVGFARDISVHPETWLEFPLLENVDDEDFDISDAQQEHALAVERLAPSLAALRIELCPGYMSESQFWKIYFVLLHPRLNDHDAQWLSTLEILKTRDLLAHELKNRSSTKLEEGHEEKPSGQEIRFGSQIEESLSVPSDKSSSSPAYSETLKHQTDEMPIAGEKDVSESKDQTMKSVSSSYLHENDEEDADEWLKEETPETFASSGVTVPIENEDEVSFSDLEDDDDGNVASSSKHTTNSFKKDSPDWVQLRESSSDSSKDIDVKNSDNESVNAREKESNDWLDFDDIDVA